MMPRSKLKAKVKLRPKPPAPPPDTGEMDELQLREVRASEWKLFRRDNLFTQRRLAEIVGVSRRTIQLVEGAHITPHPQTLRRFEVFRIKCGREGALKF
jgi:DNA-binding XRE family transcriptional regulator